MEFSKTVLLSHSDKKRQLRLPKKPNTELAEFIGLLAGDGYIGKYKEHFSFLEIAGDKKLDHDYLTNYVSNKIFNLFNLNSKIYFRKKQNTMYLRLMSKGLNLYLQEIGFPLGLKKEMKIPRWILKDEKHMAYFIKGLADTDGCLALLKSRTKKRRYYPRIQIALCNQNIINSVADYLRKKDISVCVSMDSKTINYKGINKTHIGHRIQISGYKQLEKWMDLIGFRNKRHLDKYKKIKKSGPTGI